MKKQTKQLLMVGGAAAALAVAYRVICKNMGGFEPIPVGTTVVYTLSTDLPLVGRVASFETDLCGNAVYYRIDSPQGQMGVSAQHVRRASF